MGYSKMKWIMVFFVAAWLGSAGADTIVYPDDSMATIQNAINAASDGETIWLADGIFSDWDGNRDIDFLGKSITVRSMSGDPNTCIIDCQGFTSNPHRGFIFVHGEGPASVLEGVSIISGLASNSSGGGILCDNYSSPTINNCIISHNRTDSFGGGILIGYGCSPHISNCTLSCNTALDDGGGIANFGTPTIENCVISYNHTMRHGGGMTSMATNNLTLVQCSFSHNDADEGSGLSVFGDPNCSLKGCTFSGNSTIGPTSGGAILIGNYTLLTLQNCTLSDNASNTAASGLCVIWNSTAFLNNTIIAFGRKGEAVYCEPSCGAFLTCCDVYGNAGGDWVGPIAGQNGINGNISLDPLFCNRPAEEYGLYTDSPCAPANSPCGLMGAEPPSCIRGDLDSDKDVDLTDFAELARHWLETIP